MAHDVFISYAKGDRARAAELASALEVNGWSVWWDRDIPPGRTFDEVIEEALTQTRSVVVLWSAESVKSRWVRTEASAAAERGTLVPALIEPVTIPLEFRRLEAADLTRWRGDRNDPEFQQLVETLAGLIQADAQRVATPAVAAATVRAPIVRRVPVWVPVLGAFIAGAGLVYVLTARDGTSGGASSEAASGAPVSSAPSGAAGVQRAGAAAPEAREQGGSPAPSPAAPPTGRINLLSSANGGHLMAAPTDSWRYPIDDDSTNWQYIQAGSGDAVYAFKDERPATFDTFLMLITDTSGLNIKEFELLAGSDAPLGGFESIGRFQTQNIRLYPSPWQEFTFRPVRAKYFKLHVISAWDAGWNTSPKVVEWQLLGRF
jgi:TIR domain-containing protein